MSVYQWIGSNNADLGSGGNWVDVSEPGMGQPPGVNDVAIIEVGAGLYGTLDVAALDLVQASGAPPLSITGSTTQVTAASVGIGDGFTLDAGATLDAGTLGIDGGGTAVTVQNNAVLNDSAGQNDVLDIGASTGNASLLITKGGNFNYDSSAATGTLNLGDVSNSTATLTVSAGGYFSASLDSLNIGAVSGATATLNVTGAGSQFLVDNYGYTAIGDFGERGGSAQGTVSVTGGGYASLSSYGELDIGTSAGMAKVLVSGANSAIEAGPYVEVGIDGSNIAGEILVQSGGEFDTATDLYLNNGTLAVTGANSLYTGRILSADSGTTIQVGMGGLIHVADLHVAGDLELTGGSVNVRADLSLYGGSLTIGYGTITGTSISNAGMIVASDGGTLTIGNTSSLVTASGGAYQANTGSTLAFTGASDSFAGAFTGSGTIDFASGTDTLASGASLAAKTTVVSGATLALAANITDSGAFTVSAGTVSLGSDTLTVSGASSFTTPAAGVSTFTGPGTIATNGATADAGVVIGGGAIWSNNGTVTQTATTQIGDSTSKAASIQNHAGATFKISTDTGITHGSAATSTFLNAGTFIKSAGTGTSVIGVQFENHGSVEVATGTLDFTMAVSASSAGKVKVDAGATLEFGSSVAANNAVTLGGVGSTLQLDHATAAGTAFSGTVAGLTASNALDVRDVGFSGATTTATYSGTASSGTLTVTDGNHTAKIGLVGNYQSSVFTLASDGHSGTHLTLHA